MIKNQSIQMQNWRKTNQFLMPARKGDNCNGKYDIYPAFCIADGKINIEALLVG
jgi:hypothetical protein